MHAASWQEWAMGSGTPQTPYVSITLHDSAQQGQCALDHKPPIHLVTDPWFTCGSGKLQQKSTFISSCSPPTSGSLRAEITN